MVSFPLLVPVVNWARAAAESVNSSSSGSIFAIFENRIRRNAGLVFCDRAIETGGKEFIIVVIRFLNSVLKNAEVT